MEASRRSASSKPSPLIQQTSALPDFLSSHPTFPVITLCCFYFANLTTGPLSRWSRVLASSVEQEGEEGGEVRFYQHQPEGAATSASLVCFDFTSSDAEVWKVDFFIFFLGGRSFDSD